MTYYSRISVKSFKIWLVPWMFSWGLTRNWIHIWARVAERDLGLQNDYIESNSEPSCHLLKSQNQSNSPSRSPILYGKVFFVDHWSGEFPGATSRNFLTNGFQWENFFFEWIFVAAFIPFKKNFTKNYQFIYLTENKHVKTKIKCKNRWIVCFFRKHFEEL